MENSVAGSTERSDMANSVSSYVKWGKKKYEATRWYGPEYEPCLPGDYQVGKYPNDTCSVIIWWDGLQWCYPWKDKPKHVFQDWWFRGWTGKIL